jgi:hypothetical protein
MDTIWIYQKSPDIQQKLQNYRETCPEIQYNQKCSRPASTTKASCNDKSTGSLHANKLNFVIETSQYAKHWQDLQCKSMANKQSFLLDYVNSVMDRYFAVNRTRGSTHAFRCCDVSVVGYLYVDAVCDKAFE